MVAPSSNRKMLAAREDLADQMSAIAAQRGLTLFSLVNELLEVAIKVEDMGISLKEAVDAYELTREAQNASFTLVLESLLYDTSDLAFEKASPEALKIWFDAGVWVAKRYIARGVKDPLSVYEQELKVFGWNISSFTFDRNGQDVSIRIVSPRFSKNFTVLFNSYLLGILSGSGYGETFNEVGRGNIRLE
ncbi:MAG: hypothetical protein ACM3JE_04770, partial [Betaproteobacteria bacterium]